jgi:hypothetical protein
LKELKYDYGADGFCLHTFDGTEAVFRLICALYNLVAAFKADVTHDPAPQLSRLRTQHFVTGAIVGRDGREVVLRLGLRGRYRERFAMLLERIDSAARSTVTQLRNTLQPLAFIAARPWRARPPQRSVAPSSQQCYELRFSGSALTWSLVGGIRWPPGPLLQVRHRL